MLLGTKAVGTRQSSALGPCIGLATLCDMGTQLTPPLQKGGTAPNFRPMSTVAKRSPISATADCRALVQTETFAQKKSKKVIGRNCSGPKMLSAEIDV